MLPHLLMRLKARIRHRSDFFHDALKRLIVFDHQNDKGCIHARPPDRSPAYPRTRIGFVPPRRQLSTEPCGREGPVNKEGPRALTSMPKRKPTTCPMTTQPMEQAWAISTPGVPAVGGGKNAPKPKQKPTKDRSGPCREGQNNAAQLLAETAGRLEELVSRVHFSIQGAKVGQSLHRQAVLVLFTFEVLFHQVLGKLFTRSLRLGPVRESAKYSQCVRSTGRMFMELSQEWFEPLGR